MDKELAERLDLHWQLLLAANSRFNLTAITDRETALKRHYLDCLLAAEKLRPYLREGAEMADIGSGGGFPGLVLAAAMPGVPCCLLEAAGKKACFLQECGEQMSLPQVSVLALRAEEAGRDPLLRAHFDLVTARAVAELAVLSEYALPLLKEQGIFAAMKGPKAEQELADAKNALQILGGELLDIIEYSLEDEQRSLVLIRKTATTPDKYPRRPGMPSKRPL